MYCPKCKKKYTKDIKECPECNIELVDELPKERNNEYVFVELITVLIPADRSMLLIAKSILEDAGIRYYAKNENVQDLFGIGQIGSGFNTFTGPIEIQVSKEDENIAKELLKEFK